MKKKLGGIPYFKLKLDNLKTLGLIEKDTDKKRKKRSSLGPNS
jgi:hypothetical protein